MSYTYLQEPGAESLAVCFSDIEPFVRSKLNLTVEKSCCNGNETESCPGSRSGMTCGHSTASLGGESSMSSAVDSLARISQSPERAQELTESDPGYGVKWPASSAKYDRNSRSWKTHQRLLAGDLEKFSGTFPKWGMVRGGELFPLPTPALRTSESGSGFWPTPLSSDATHGGPNQRDSRGRPSLTMAAMMWPTPTKSDGMGGPGNSGRDGGENLRTAAGGRLNPNWVEWLMGWPIGWTDLKPLETDRYQAWLRSHGGF